ncbi:unnamed protein product [Pleuronectes platessa]|uniref:Uncharacterized protein n=1 Tax=Pleuronectes platessa TaxID=8262 RepID=A0A9N7TND4_PLEPL|nr:unnamed protein product [Pleuronectes platessa]
MAFRHDKQIVVTPKLTQSQFHTSKIDHYIIKRVYKFQISHPVIVVGGQQGAPFYFSESHVSMLPSLQVFLRTFIYSYSAKSHVLSEAFRACEQEPVAGVLTSGKGDHLVSSGGRNRAM